MRTSVSWAAATAMAANILFVSPLGAAKVQRLHAYISPSCALEIDVRTNAEASCWRLKCGTKPMRKLGCDFGAMHQIDSVLIAPNHEYIAVLSVGEGHPIVEIAALAPLLKTGKFSVKCELNPYPGTIALGDWRNGKLTVQTDIDITLLDIEQRALSIGEAMREYRIDPAYCRFTRVAKTGR